MLFESEHSRDYTCKKVEFSKNDANAHSEVTFSSRWCNPMLAEESRSLGAHRCKTVEEDHGCLAVAQKPQRNWRDEPKKNWIYGPKKNWINERYWTPPQFTQGCSNCLEIWMQDDAGCGPELVSLGTLPSFPYFPWWYFSSLLTSFLISHLASIFFFFEFIGLFFLFIVLHPCVSLFPLPSQPYI